MTLNELLRVIPGLQMVSINAEIGTGETKNVCTAELMNLDFSGIETQGNISWKAQDMLYQQVIRLEPIIVRVGSGSYVRTPKPCLSVTVDCTEIYTSKEDFQ